MLGRLSYSVVSKQFHKHVAGPEEETHVHISVRIEILAARDDICSHILQQKETGEATYQGQRGKFL